MMLMTKEMVSAFRNRKENVERNAKVRQQKKQKLTSNDHETTDDDIDFTLGEEEDELYEISDNSEWEVSDFLSSSDSGEEWNL